ncbi:MAG TPA: beta-ketoacyl synthase N-terminal-like domain-containing protein [Vicinamibacterales bacterium]|nr:beta-ketoacyl synthase N-terminal-like domain-containing protein [Vicinamibacterales bacterium]
MTDPVAITGGSCISGLGLGRTAFDSALRAGRSAISAATFDTSALQSHLAGQIVDFDPAAFIAPGKLRRIDRIGRLAVACCRLALDDAGLRGAVGDGEVAVVIGTQTAGIHSLVEYLDRLIAQGPPGASALDFSNTVGNAAASLCGIELGLRGANVTVNNKEASALGAVAYAMSLIGSGPARAVVTGGVDDIEATFFATHERFGVLASDEGHGEASRPFDRRRNGFVMGSGAFLIVLESAASVEARGVTPRGHLLGIGATAATCRLNDWPRQPAQLVRCMRDALDRANLEPRDVAVVFASANSTQALDRVEAAALAEVFGAGAVPVTSLKGALGECGATGAAGILAALTCLDEGVIPPTAGFAESDPECPVDVSASPRPLPPRAGRVALVNSFASGGTSYAAVVRA